MLNREPVLRGRLERSGDDFAIRGANLQHTTPHKELLARFSRQLIPQRISATQDGHVVRMLVIRLPDDPCLPM